MSFMRPQFERQNFRTIGTDEACPDCHYYISSDGEMPDEPSAEWEAPALEDLEEGERYRADGGDSYFSHSDCPFCGAIAGTRYDVDTIDTKASSVAWRLSAPGYLDCTDWTEADNDCKAVSDMLGMYGDSFDDSDYNACFEFLGDNAQAFRRGYFLAIGFTARHSDDIGDCLFPCEPGADFAECYDSEDIESAIDPIDEGAPYYEALADCLGFFVDNVALIEQWGEGFERAGACFHYARNGHGVTFTDNTPPDSDEQYRAAISLQDNARPFGEFEFPEKSSE